MGSNKSSLKINGMKCFLTFGYVGLSPIMPGTIGSLVALIPILLLNVFLSYPVAQAVLGGMIIITFVVGVIGCRRYAESVFGEEDPSSIVIDEVVGMWLSLWLYDFTSFSKLGFNFDDLYIILIAFLLFRFFDITKIAGIRYLETIPQGWGVMLDDLAAGGLTFLVIRAVEWWT